MKKLKYALLFLVLLLALNSCATTFDGYSYNIEDVRTTEDLYDKYDYIFTEEEKNRIVDFVICGDLLHIIKIDCKDERGKLLYKIKNKTTFSISESLSNFELHREAYWTKTNNFPFQVEWMIIDDYKFDGPRGIWHDSDFTLKVLRHFAGAITPDFSTYQDFPEPLKLYNTYRMRVYGCWLSANGIKVINNVRWGTSETYRYCFDGIPEHSIVAIGTCGGSPRRLIDRKRFDDGIDELVKRLHPHTIVVYGSAKYPCFERLKEQGITVVEIPSQMMKAFEGRVADE